MDDENECDDDSFKRHVLGVRGEDMLEGAVSLKYTEKGAPNLFEIGGDGIGPDEPQRSLSDGGLQTPKGLESVHARPTSKGSVCFGFDSKDALKAMQFVMNALNESSMVLREHSMQKKSKWMRRWRKRWTVFMFDPYSNISYLATYRNRRSYKWPTECILMNEQIQVFADDQEETAFCIELNDAQNTSFWFKAESNKLRDEWVSLLVSRKSRSAMLGDV